MAKAQRFPDVLDASSYGEEIAELEKVHGAAAVERLITELNAVPSLRHVWPVERDLSLIYQVWSSRSRPGMSRRRRPAPTMDARSVAPRAGDGAESAAAGARRLQELRAKLPARTVTEFIDMRPEQPPVPEAVPTDWDAAPMRLAYDKATLLDPIPSPPTRPGEVMSPDVFRSPLPFGHLLEEKYVVDGNCRVAALIPEEWPLRINSSQIHVGYTRTGAIDRMASSGKLPYEVDGVTRTTTVEDILEDLRNFLEPAIGATQAAKLQLAMATLQDDDSVTFEVLNPRSTTVETDLFNLGVATLKHSRKELLVTTVLEPVPLPEPAQTPPSPMALPVPPLDTPPAAGATSPPTPITVLRTDEAPTSPQAPPQTPARTPAVAVQLPEPGRNPINPPHRFPVAPGRPGALGLAARVAIARQGAGNTHPVAPPHNGLANAMIGEPLNHAPETNLPTSRGDYRKLKTHIKKIQSQPTRCCFNCGMLNYPASGDTIRVKARGPEDLRAWRVFRPVIEAYQRERNIPPEELFLCEPTDPNANGHPMCKVYSCGACKKARCQDPCQYDLFDGHSSTSGQWTYESIGVGEPMPEPLAALSCDERIALGVVKMADATFSPAYSSSGYMHFSNGAFLQPGDYHGLAALLIQDPAQEGLARTRRATAEQATSRGRLRAALEYLLDSENGNPLVRETLTCYERELERQAAAATGTVGGADAFPVAAGAGALPVMAWDDQAFREPGERRAEEDAAAAGAAPAHRAAPPPPGAGGRAHGGGVEPARTLAPRGITGLLQTVVEPPADATLRQNGIQNLTVGDRRARTGHVTLQAAVATTEAASVGAALHPTLYHTGRGAFHQTDTACDEQHFNKARLASVNPKFRRCTEFLWGLYQGKVKKQMHAAAARTVAPQMAATATQGGLAAQEAALRQANPTLGEALTTEESFTGPVPKILKGSKRYWRAAFIQIMAMCVEYGAPEFFLTLTANEMGWTDLRKACGGMSHSARPVEATRHYNHRWQEFKGRYLTGMTPIGQIERMWYRHEEQGRGSLHVHAAIWVKAGTRNEAAICATVPRGTQEAIARDPNHALDAGMTATEKEWRKFIVGVQTHNCREGCKWKHGERITETHVVNGETCEFCKVGYPHEIWSAAALATSPDGVPTKVLMNDVTHRYEYRTERKEDERISPYVPLWVLAWGANMNIQFCTAAGFLGYISKYVPKPEPSGLVEDTPDLREREGRDGRQARYLNARKVGAPECVFDMFQYKMKEGESINHLTTQPPAHRRRCIFRQGPGRIDDEDEDEEEEPLDPEAPLRFFDGDIEKYEKRPEGERELLHGQTCDFDELTYPEFWRRFDYVSWSQVSQKAIHNDVYWYALGQPDLPRDDLAGGALPPKDSKWIVLRLGSSREAVEKPHPIWWDWKLPSKHHAAYYYQKLLLSVPFRDSTPSSFITHPPAPGEPVHAGNANGNASGSLREECILRELVNGEDEMATLEADARARHFSPEQVTAMLAAEGEYAGTEEAVLDAMQGEDAALLGDLGPVDAGANDETPEDRARLAAELDAAEGPGTEPPPPPIVHANGIWDEILADGTIEPVQLNEEQHFAYLKLTRMGDKQLLVYLSGQGGTGKSTLIRLITQSLRSRGFRVLLCASSGKAARLIGGHTVHSAFKLHQNGLFMNAQLEGQQGTRHFNYLATVDVIIIDEISMLTASALHGVHQALNYVVTRGTTQRGHMVFGRKSVLSIGDLYQLPAVERAQYREQVYHSTLWSEFKFLELTQIMRLDDEEIEFAGLLSRARKGWQHLTDDDWTLLETRLCSSHCPPAECVPYTDVMRVRPPGGSRRDEREISQRVFHCPCANPPTGVDGAPDFARAPCVLAARRAKVDDLNSVHAREHGRQTVRIEAVDTASGGSRVFDPSTRNQISERLSGMPQCLDVHIGQLVVITVNRRRTHAGFVNGSLAVIVAIAPPHAPTELTLRLLDEPDEAPLLKIRRVESSCTVSQADYTRLMFPVIPAFAMTIHRVQGATLTGDVHVLLNKEVFADGQAYVALSRVQRLSQLHLWCLERTAIKAEPSVTREYERLERWRLTDEFIAEAPAREAIRHLLPLVANRRDA